MSQLFKRGNRWVDVETARRLNAGETIEQIEGTEEVIEAPVVPVEESIITELPVDETPVEIPVEAPVAGAKKAKKTK